MHNRYFTFPHADHASPVKFLHVEVPTTRHPIYATAVLLRLCQWEVLAFAFRRRGLSVSTAIFGGRFRCTASCRFSGRLRSFPCISSYCGVSVYCPEKETFNVMNYTSHVLSRKWHSVPRTASCFFPRTQGLRITRSDTRPHVKWDIILVTEYSHFNLP